MLDRSLRQHSAYIFTGGLPFKLTEGDLLAVFSQFGEIVDVNLVRNKVGNSSGDSSSESLSPLSLCFLEQETGKSRGFAFLAYVNQKSTDLAVDNLNGATVGGRTISVDHVLDYKRKKKEMGVEDGEENDGDRHDDREKQPSLQGERRTTSAPEQTGECAKPKAKRLSPLAAVCSSWCW